MVISRPRPYLRPAPMALALFALILVLPGLGRFGLWEPEELRLAETAAQASDTGLRQLWQVTAGSGSPGRALWPALGMAVAGVNETAARLPGALLALAGLAALAWAGAGLYGGRAGLFAAAVLATSPLFVLQARQLTSDAPLLLGHALAVGALARLAGPARSRLTVASLLLGALGLALSTLAAGVLMGALPPLAAGLGAALLGGGDRDGQADGRDRPLARPELTALAIATGLLVLGIALGSYTAGVPSWWLGGVPTGASPSHSFETLLRVHGFGLFPFTALAALALLQPLAGPAATHSDADGTGLRFGDGLVSLLAVLGLALGAAQLHLTGEARLVALLPAALATGRLLDQLADRARDPAGLPALALGSFAAIGTIICARDLSQNPEQLVSLHLRSKLAWPPGLDVGWLLALGIAGALAALILTARPPGESRPARWLRTGAAAGTGCAAGRLWRAGAGAGPPRGPRAVAPPVDQAPGRRVSPARRTRGGAGAGPGRQPGVGDVPAGAHAAGGGHRRPGPGVPGAAVAVRPRPPQRPGDHPGPFQRVGHPLRGGRRQLQPAAAAGGPPPARPAGSEPAAPGAVATRHRQRRRSALAAAPTAADQHVRRHHPAGGRRPAGHAAPAGAAAADPVLPGHRPPARRLQDLRPPRARRACSSPAITRRSRICFPPACGGPATCCATSTPSRSRWWSPPPAATPSTSASGRAATTPAGCR